MFCIFCSEEFSASFLSSYFSFFLNLLRLCWIFVAVYMLSLVVTSESYSPVMVPRLLVFEEVLILQCWTWESIGWV